MINSVRNTVISALNKNNYGYLTPSDFNLFADQAQREIFESYFNQQNYQINKANQKLSGTGDSGIIESMAETIELFSKPFSLLPVVEGEVSNYMTLPEDMYKIQRMNHYRTRLSSGSADSFASGRLRDSTALFTSESIIPSSIVTNTNTGEVSYVVRVVSDTEIILTKDIFSADNPDYAIFNSRESRQIDKTSQGRIMMLINSLDTSPSAIFPVYSMSEIESDATGQLVCIHPESITTTGSVVIQYLRYPKEPKWTYSDVPTSDGEPLFDPTQPDYQDFELPKVSEHTLVLKILEYAGLSIRELQVADAAMKMEDRETNLER